MERLPAPGLDWLAALAERLSAEQRAALLELLDCAAYAGDKREVFALLTRTEIDAAIARLAGA